MVGLWFLAAEHLRLGSWDLIKGYSDGSSNSDIDPRIGMQIVNEAAICRNRVRRKNYFAHQGFELLNGLGFLVSDEQVNKFFENKTVSQAKELQEALSKIRFNHGDYEGKVIAVDPHRLPSSTKRIMPKKKKQPTESSKKMLQTFFALDTQTGQPIGCTMGTPGVNTTKATMELLGMVNSINDKALVLADKEHFTEKLLSFIKHNTNFEFLVPALSTQRIKKMGANANYQNQWAGYAIAEEKFNFRGANDIFRLLIQREGIIESQCQYKSFLGLSKKEAVELLSDIYPKRWSIEEFFNFEGAGGFDRASTFNLNIRYGKLSLALIAQAAKYQLRKKLPEPYCSWDATHLANAIFNGIDGDIKVKGDTIIVTCYNVPREWNLGKYYQNLPEKLSKEGINPKIPWMYNFKLDFKFK